VANGVVYIISADGNLYAFNAKTGAIIWNTITGNSVTSSPAVANGIVYIGLFNGNLSAFNATTGASLWSAFVGGAAYSSPAVANGIVYIGAGDYDKLDAFHLPGITS
jgi:outer membrane protein assembly factor BamB